jgi:hypothetical protein
MSDALEFFKTVGALVGLVTGIFVVIDRFLRDRPIVDMRPHGSGGGRHPVQLVVTNVSKQSILIRRIDCKPVWLAASASEELGAIVRAAAGTQVRLVILPGETHTNYLITRGEWEDLKDEEAAVSVVVRWSFTSSTWLPQVPVWRRSTVGEFNALRTTPGVQK